MQFTQTVSMAFKAISGNKVRAFLTMLGVIIGVMSVIVLIAIGQGTTASVTESISSMGTNLLTFSSFKLWDPELGSSNGRAYPLSRTYTLGMTVSL